MPFFDTELAGPMGLRYMGMVAFGAQGGSMESWQSLVAPPEQTGGARRFTVVGVGRREITREIPILKYLDRRQY